MNTTKIVKKIENDEFRRIFRRYNPNIKVSPHAFDHLSDAQRKIFAEQDLINILTKESQVGGGMQKNGRYAVFFKRKKGYTRIIFGLSDSTLEIITFINTENIPNLDRL